MQDSQLAEQQLSDQWAHMNSYNRPMQEPNLRIGPDVIADLMKLKTELDEFEGSLRGLKKIPIFAENRGNIKGYQFIPIMLECKTCKLRWLYNHKVDNHNCSNCNKESTPIRLMNEIGVNNIMQNLRIQTIPKIFGFTYLLSHQIEKIIIAFSLEVCSDLFDNMDEYELSEKDFQTVHSQIIEIKNAVLQRSLEGFIPKILQTMVFKEEKSIQDLGSGARQQQSKSILERSRSMI